CASRWGRGAVWRFRLLTNAKCWSVILCRQTTCWSRALILEENANGGMWSSAEATGSRNRIRPRCRFLVILWDYATTRSACSALSAAAFGGRSEKHRERVSRWRFQKAWNQCEPSTRYIAKRER